MVTPALGENEGIMGHLKGKAISFGGWHWGKCGNCRDDGFGTLENDHISIVMLIFQGVNASHFGKIKLVHANVAGNFEGFPLKRLQSVLFGLVSFIMTPEFVGPGFGRFFVWEGQVEYPNCGCEGRTGDLRCCDVAGYFAC